MPSFVYFIRSEQEPPMFKIGKADNVEARLANLQVGCPSKLTLMGSIKCIDGQRAKLLEADLHQEFKLVHSRGEWFYYNPEVREAIRCLLVNPFRRQLRREQFPPEEKPIKKRKVSTGQRRSPSMRKDANYRAKLAEARDRSYGTI